MRAIGDVKPGAVALHDPLVPTRPPGDCSNAIATTAFVRRAFFGLQPPVVGQSPPAGPCPGQLWWSTEDVTNGGGQLYVWTGKQWVAASCCPGEEGDTVIPSDTVLGNVSDAAAPATPLTQTQLTALIYNFTDTLSGTVPAAAGVYGGQFAALSPNAILAQSGWKAQEPLAIAPAINWTIPDDVRSIWLQNNLAVAATWTLPSWQNVGRNVNGHVIRMVLRITGSPLTITAEAGDLLTSAVPANFQQSSLTLPAGYQGFLTFVYTGGGNIFVINDGPAIVGAAIAGPVLPFNGTTTGSVPAPPASTPTNYVLQANGTWAPPTTSPGGGTVTSVAMTVPGGLSVSGSPITGAGTLAVSWSGTIPNAQVPAPAAGALGGVFSAAAPANQFMTGISTSGAPVFAAPAAPQLRMSMQVFTASGTYTPAAGLQWAIVETVGGGGGGGGAAAGSNGGAGGGASGGYSRSVLSAAQIGTSQAVTIGNGGTGVAGNGNAGGATSFGTLVSANGGGGGGVINPTNLGVGGSAGSITGAAGQFRTIGNDGDAGLFLYDGTVLYGVPGSGGSTLFGGRTSAPIGTGPANGNNGNPAAANTGAGGAGAWSVASTINRIGGNGGSGVCIVTELAF